MSCFSCIGELCSRKSKSKVRQTISGYNRKNIRSCYDLQKELGTGSYGSVCKGTRKVDGSIRAIKSINKATGKKPSAEDSDSIKKVRLEVEIMKMMDHPGIIKLHETFEDAKNIYLVMELADGGELFERIVSAGHFKETQAAIVMKQMIGAILYMHKNKICHRDLKPENFIFSSKAAIENNVLKLIDFGLSATIKPGKNFTTKAGTPYYVAPQVLEGSYDESCDIWSCGVIMYVLLCGYPPFYHHDSDKQVLKLVTIGKYTYDKNDWAGVSMDAKKLIDSMLVRNQNSRYNAEQAYNHVWIQKKAPKAKDVPLPSGMLDKLRNFRSANRLKKAALHVIAGLLSEDKIKRLTEMFKTLDKNGDGMLSAAELQDGLKSAGITQLPSDLQQIFQDLDTDQSGSIDYSEFLAAALDQRQYIQEDVCWSAFCAFDKDGNGKISQNELLEVLKDEGISSSMGKQAVLEVMEEVDKDGNGEIDFQEFMLMMRNVSSK